MILIVSPISEFASLLYHHFGWDGDAINISGNDQATSNTAAQIAKSTGGVKPLMNS
jgi:hypothetical protein